MVNPLGSGAGNVSNCASHNRYRSTAIASDTFGIKRGRRGVHDDLTQCLHMIAWKYPYQVSLYPENCSGQGSAATPDKHKTAEVIDRWALSYSDDPRGGRSWCCRSPILGEKKWLLNKQRLIN